MEKKSLTSPIVLTVLAAAFFTLIVTVILMFTGGSRFPKTSYVPKPTPQPTVMVIKTQTTEKGRDQAIERARKDLMTKLKITAETIAVVTAEEITWPDTSLGCPKTGMFYAQVLTPGYKIILFAKGKKYDYHAGSGESLILCPNKS